MASLYKLIRPIIFKVSSDPENMHRAIMSILHAVELFPPACWVEKTIFNFENGSLKQNIFGLEFKNPVGLAGGFDKHGEAVKSLANLGFGFLEIGTVTQNAQPGNPRPRIVRLEKDSGLINRMGFNNKGADALAANLFHRLRYPNTVPIGINLGKSKVTPLEEAPKDYLYSFTKLYSSGDYFVINVSSPNTPGLRQLVDKDALIGIISTLKNYRDTQTIKKPIFLKIVIDFSLEAIDDALKICQTYGIEGIICSNTSLGREGLSEPTSEVGGLSGKPIKDKSTEIIRHIYKQMPSLPIIGVGGIFNSEDAYEKIKAGARLVQIYTGLIYEGPGLVKKINKGLVELLKRDGLKNISEAVGIETK